MRSLLIALGVLGPACSHHAEEKTSFDPYASSRESGAWVDHDRDWAGLLARDWRGGSEVPVATMEDGVLHLQHRLQISVDGEGQLHGTMVTTVDVDDIAYTSQAEVSGYVIPAHDQLFLVMDHRSEEDELPEGLSWCDFNATLTVYAIEDQSGHFALDGPMTTACGGAGTMHLSDV
jgi:hypothetical protein